MRVLEINDEDEDVLIPLDKIQYVSLCVFSMRDKKDKFRIIISIHDKKWSEFYDDYGDAENRFRDIKKLLNELI